MSHRIALSMAALVAGLSSQAEAQIAGDSYFIAPGLGSAAAGFALASGTPLADSTIDGLTESVGTTLVAAASIDSTDAVVDNGGGNFTVTLTLSSTDELAPGGFAIGGIAADTAGLFLGANAGADPINFTNAAIVNTATVTLLDAAGAIVGGPFDVSGFANFADPAFGGGWNGSLGVTFGAGSAGAGIAGYVVEVNYTEGAPLGSFVTAGTGCPAGAEVLLSADSLPAIGATTTITASPLPAGTVLATLLIGDATGGPLPLDLIGATGCFLELPSVFIDIGMAIAGTDATLPLGIPADPGLVGFVVDTQCAAVSPGVNPLGLVMSDFGRITVGG